MFTQFLTRTQSVVRVLVITTIFILNNLVAFVVWAAAGQGLATWARKYGRARVIDRLLALTLTAVSGRFLVGAW